MRLIDADELIVQFRRAIETFLPNDPRRHMNLGDSLKCHGWEQGLMVIQEAPTIQPSPHWIPVTERVPEVGKSVMICDAYGDICTGHRTNSGYYFPDFCEDKIKDVRAWAELPEPYKEVTT